VVRPEPTQTLDARRQTPNSRTRGFKAYGPGYQEEQDDTKTEDGGASPSHLHGLASSVWRLAS
jgi:hypothetical protein